MSKYRRKKLIIDRTVQGALLLRAGYYWCTCLLAIVLMWSCWLVIVDRPQTSLALLERVGNQLCPALLASCLIMPIVLIDCMRLSNRFAGPIFRMRRALRQLIDEGDAEYVKLRDGDYWHGFADEFNELVDKCAGRSTDSQQG